MFIHLKKIGLQRQLKPYRKSYILKNIFKKNSLKKYL